MNFGQQKGNIELAMTSKDIEKLEQADQIMFDLNNSHNPKEDILKVGQLLKEAGILQNATNDLNTIVDVYNQNAHDEIKKAIRKRMAATVKLNLKAIEPYLSDDDDTIAEFVNECLDDFKKYGQIVLRFNDKKATWKTEKSTEDFQQLFHEIDERRHNIHNKCIGDIRALNNIISKDSNKKSMFATWDDSNIKEVTKIPRSDIGNAILELYLEELMQKITDRK